MDLKIEKGIPLPPAPKGWGLAAVFRNMVVGDSVFIPNGGTNSTSAKARAALGKGVVTIRKEEGGVRVWRIK